jgi:hypothetical protein
MCTILTSCYVRYTMSDAPTRLFGKLTYVNTTIGDAELHRALRLWMDLCSRTWYNEGAFRLYQKRLRLLRQPLSTETVYPGWECPICYNSMSPNRPVSTTVCGHHFHVQCIGRVVESSTVCPMCRTELFQ